MTREKEIIIAAEINADNYAAKFSAIARMAFAEGARWADEHPKNPWVSVEDRLPEKAIGLYELEEYEQHKMVLFKTANGKLFRGYLDAEEIWRAFTLPFKVAYPIDSITWSKVTHWMPIPETPKGGEV